jgi:tRNA A-37 threonylcarbamoyl transferase component Bud32
METLRDPRQYLVKRRPLAVLDEGRILAAEADLAELQEIGLDTVAKAMAFGGGTLVRAAGPRTTHRLEGPRSVFFLKRHRDLPFRERFWPFCTTTSSPARVEWDNHLIMRRAGFDVPDPVAMGETRSNFSVPSESFLVTREVPGPSLDQVLEKGRPWAKDMSQHQLTLAAVRDLSGLVRRLHSSGFIHRDLYFAHLIVKQDPRWGRPYLVDLQRVEQRFPPRHRWLVKDLSALAFSAPVHVSQSDKLRFLLQYLGKARVDPLVRRWIKEIEARLLRMQQHAPAYP